MCSLRGKLISAPKFIFRSHSRGSTNNNNTATLIWSSGEDTCNMTKDKRGADFHFCCFIGRVASFFPLNCFITKKHVHHNYIEEEVGYFPNQIPRRRKKDLSTAYLGLHIILI